MSHSRDLRTLLLLVLLAGCVGAIAELLLQAHYEDSMQLAPLVCLSLALMAIAGRLLSPSARSVHALRVAMGVLCSCGFLGVLFHLQASYEMQHELSSDLFGWELWTKVLRAKAPPALAPFVLVQFSLLGWVATYRDPTAAE